MVPLSSRQLLDYEAICGSIQLQIIHGRKNERESKRKRKRKRNKKELENYYFFIHLLFRLFFFFFAFVLYFVCQFRLLPTSFYPPPFIMYIQTHFFHLFF